MNARCRVIRAELFSSCLFVYRRNIEVVSPLVCVFVCLFFSLSTASFLVFLTLYSFYFSFSSPRLALLLVLPIFSGLLLHPFSSFLPYSIHQSFFLSFPSSPSLFLPSFLCLILPSSLPPTQNVRKNGDVRSTFILHCFVTCLDGVYKFFDTGRDA